MNIRSIPLACITAVIAAPAAHAFQPPVDDAPPPPSIEIREAPQGRLELRPKPNLEPVDPRAARDAQPPAEKLPGFLGINVIEVPEALAAHIDLPAGQGVMVRLVAPGSAAEAAGLQLHDVILRINGQPVACHDDVAKIVSKQRAGDTARIEVLRKGETQIVDAVLAPKPIDAMEDFRFGRQIEPQGFGMDNLFFDELPEDHAGRIRDMIERNLRALREPGGLMEDDVFQDAFRGMREQMQQLLENPERFAPLQEREGLGNIQMNAGATVRMMDNEGSVEIKMIDGSKEITVRDLDNEVIWLGPWDTAQDKAAAPDDVRERIERLNIDRFHGGNGLRLQLFGDR